MAAGVRGGARVIASAPPRTAERRKVPEIKQICPKTKHNGKRCGAVTVSAELMTLAKRSTAANFRRRPQRSDVRCT
ncbi:hypothetical protein AAFF_G00392010 [Aldrovandia affinis]|uniref:Uncharacterized protein n=1 Tax=Aldrovandia affinis TaxID=143900 RepID=A0AAD7SE04_9TELE|nr:hypothetical protein AAFF_G00392010 [Aldrovandia affinis]